ncbi:MAG: hypothetical protein PHQ60_09300 [Sideroxydans sp.]|nr:hypothetical protein [Sideroxydans sp.]
MKKIVLSLAGLLAATAFAPEASAVPVFARQTGMACSSCHFQHFPLLNAVGQDFKANGFTKMGAKGKFKSEDLSIADTVNMGVFTTTYFQTQSAGQTAGVTNPVAVPKWGVPGTGGELSLFIGGRISEFAGFLSEAGLGGGGTANTGGVVGAAKLVMLFPVGDARIGPVIYSSTGQGAAYSFELLNTGAAATHKMMGNGGPSDQHVQAAYAAQYLGTNTAATGISVVANNAMGFVNVGAWEMAGNDAVGGANNLDLTYMRLASTTNFGDWEVGFGIQNFGGTSSVTHVSPKATMIDGQMQGALNDMPLGLYASYGTAAASSTGTDGTNPFNGSTTNAKTSLNLAAEFGIVPHVSTVQVALRMAKNGNATNNADNALMLGVTYELAQNVGLSFHHTQQFGSAWDVVGGTEPAGKTANTLLLETLF